MIQIYWEDRGKQRCGAGYYKFDKERNSCNQQKKQLRVGKMVSGELNWGLEVTGQGIIACYPSVTFIKIIFKNRRLHTKLLTLVMSGQGM